LGEPTAYHDKRPRDVFGDLRQEFEGMVINETLWKVVDEVELGGKTYWDSYISLACGIEKNLERFNDPVHRKFVLEQTRKMKLWSEVLEKL